MPELPDIVVYIEALERFLGGKAIKNIQLRSPFVVRTFEPDLLDAVGKTLLASNVSANESYGN